MDSNTAATGYTLRYPIIHAFIIPITTIGFVLNVFVVAAIMKDKKMRKTENLLHFNLACIDILILLVGFNAVFIDLIIDEDVKDVVKTIHCSFFGFGLTTSIFALVQISVLRTKRFTQFHFNISNLQLYIAIIVDWCVSAIVMLVYSFSPLQSSNPEQCGSNLSEYQIIPSLLNTCIQIVVFGASLLILIGSLGKSISHLVQLKKLHPMPPPILNTDTRTSMFDSPAGDHHVPLDQPHSISSIQLEMFEIGHGGLAVTAASKPWVQLSPHYVARRQLVVTTFILLLCSLLFFIIPLALGVYNLREPSDLIAGFIYVCLLCNSMVTPIVYIARYEHFRKVILGWFKALW